MTREYLIVKQPIGKKLFRQFCSQNPLYNSYHEFLESIVNFIHYIVQNKIIKFD
jgi:hypothetical protein